MGLGCGDKLSQGCFDTGWGRWHANKTGVKLGSDDPNLRANQPQVNAGSRRPMAPSSALRDERTLALKPAADDAASDDRCALSCPENPSDGTLETGTVSA